MEILNIENYMLPVVLGICLVIGWVLKNWIKDVDNKVIPLIVTLLGAFLAIWVNNWSFTPEILLSGLITGASSTGMHQIFKQMIEKETNK